MTLHDRILNVKTKVDLFYIFEGNADAPQY